MKTLEVTHALELEKERRRTKKVVHSVLYAKVLGDLIRQYPFEG